MKGKNLEKANLKTVDSSYGIRAGFIFSLGSNKIHRFDPES